MENRATLEVWIVVDSDGNYATGTDADEAKTAFEQTHSGLSDAEGFRSYKISLAVPLPRPVELTGIVFAEEVQPVLSVA